MERGQNWFFGLIFSEGNSMSIQASKQGECFYSAKATYSLSGDAKILEWDVFEYTAEPSENWTASCSTINEDPVVVDIEFDQDTFTFYSPTDEFGRTCSETFSRVMKPKMRNL